MRSSRLALLLPVMLVTACSSAVRSNHRTRLSAKEMFEKAKPSVVRIEGDGVGTGFIVSPDGRIATNLHVIIGAPELWVVLADGRRLKVEQVVAFDKDRDLAIISVEAEQKLPPLKLGNSDEVSTGDRVIAIGNPLGVLDYTISDGLISARRRFPGKEVLQISAPISLGSSGGPLFNNYGEVIGIATFIAQDGQNLNFGMPANYLRPLLQVEEGQSVQEFHEKFEDIRIAFRQRQRQEKQSRGDPPKPPAPKRQVPDHEVSEFQGCSEDALVDVFRRIGRAIEIGAPVYNRGEYEACYVIYRGTAQKIRGEEGMCPGIRDALSAGLDRAASLKHPSDQAWAMRDAFDGILNVIVRKLRPNANIAP